MGEDQGVTATAAPPTRNPINPNSRTLRSHSVNAVRNVSIISNNVSFEQPNTPHSLTHSLTSSFLCRLSSFVVRRSSFVVLRPSFVRPSFVLRSFVRPSFVLRSSFVPSLFLRRSFVVRPSFVRPSFVVNSSSLSFVLRPSSFVLRPSSFVVFRPSFFVVAVVRPSSFIVHRLSFVVHPSFVVVRCSLFIVRCSLFVVRCRCPLSLFVHTPRSRRSASDSGIRCARSSAINRPATIAYLDVVACCRSSTVPVFGAFCFGLTLVRGGTAVDMFV